MHTEHFKPIKIHHVLADIEIVPAATIHQETKQRHGENYQTVGYYLKLYRLRKDLTQAQLAALVGIRQHHLSEMEHNKRPVEKKLARLLAESLNIDYHKLL